MKYLFLLIRPFVMWISTVKMPFVSKQHVFSKFYEIQSTLQEGDIILSSSSGHLSGFFIRLVNEGKYTHALLFTGEIENKPTIVEAVGEGVLFKTLPLFLADTDSICIIRPLDSTISKEEKKKVTEFALNQVGKEYDHLFEIGGKDGHKAYYCSELVYEAYRYANPKIEFIRREVMGYSTVTPNDFYNAKKFFKVIYEL